MDVAIAQAKGEVAAGQEEAIVKGVVDREEVA